MGNIAGVAWFLIAAVVTNGGQHAQTSVNDGTPLVTIEVSVVARGGRPVPGLTAADFEVKLDDRVAPIRAVTYLQVADKMTGAVGPSFDAVTPAVSAVYRLTIDVPPNTNPGREFSLSAIVRRPGVSVFANRRAVAAVPGTAVAAATAPRPAPVKTAPSTEEQLRSAIATGRTLQGVTIAMDRTLRRASDRGQVAIDVEVEIPSSVKGPITLAFGVVDATGAVRSGRKEVPAASDGSPYRLSFSLPVAPGTYKLRLAAADAAGAVGAQESIVDARLAAMGPFTTSDLLQSRDGARLATVLELYPIAGAAVPADVVVKIELAAAGNQTPEIERLVTPEPRDGMLVAEAEFALDKLTAGAYAVRATVISGATVLGTASAAFTKR
jgi:hypothetical protein